MTHKWNNQTNMLKKLSRYTLQNRLGMQVELCNFGARILTIKYPDKRGELVELTLNHKNNEGILNDDSFMGATVGRVCNRIANASFTLKDRLHKLTANEGNNTLHGGPKGFDKCFWDVVTHTSDAIRFALISPAGDQGFPGEVTVSVEYRLNERDELHIGYMATSTEATPINLCNHAYFTMGEKIMSDCSLWINADRYLPLNHESIPIGTFDTVDNTDLDFRQLTPLKQRLHTTDYDHCYELNTSQAAELIGNNSGIRLTLSTNQVALQLYSSNHLKPKHSALCLEAQGFTNAINQPEFHPDILKPNQIYQKEVVYGFSLM